MAKKEKQVKRPSEHWHRLDNTANIFPVISSKYGSNVFRYSVCLKEDIRPELLQEAVEICLQSFVIFRVKIRKGLFWFYFDENVALPRVRPEDDYPCKEIDPKENNQFLFRVTYYQNKINLEAFHALTDGAGSMPFIQAIVCRYLLLAHPEVFSEEDHNRDWFAGSGNNTEDAYVKNYVPMKKKKFKDGLGYRLRGEKNAMRNIALTHVHLPLSLVKEKSRAHGASISQYFVAILAHQIWEKELHRIPPRHPVNIVLPVDLRRMFSSQTSLNFFSNVHISFNYRGDVTFTSLLEEAKKQFTEKITKEKMLEKISYTVGSGYSMVARLIPLLIKNFGLKIYHKIGAKTASLAFSNVGGMTFPACFEPYIASAVAVLATNEREAFKCAAVSFKDTLTLTFSSTLKSKDLEQGIVQYLGREGLEPLVETSGLEY